MTLKTMTAMQRYLEYYKIIPQKITATLTTSHCCRIYK